MICGNHTCNRTMPDDGNPVRRYCSRVCQLAARSWPTDDHRRQVSIKLDMALYHNIRDDLIADGLDDPQPRHIREYIETMVALSYPNV